MQIGINGRVLLFPHTGVAKRLLNLAAALKKISADTDFTFFCQRPVFITGINTIISRCPWEWLWQNLLVPSVLKKKKIDIYDSPWGGGLPVAFAQKPCPLLTTYHDMIMLDAPETGTAASIKRKEFIHRTRQNLACADRVITVSEYSKGRIIHYFPEYEKKIAVIPNGISEYYNPVNAAAAGKNLRLPQRYIFYAGGFNKRKNVESLIAAFKKIIFFQDISLILGGSHNNYFNKHIRPLLSNIAADKVFCPGYISEEILPGFYSRAEMLVYPSLLEGFGMPALEAFGCGCPVIAHNGSSLPEISGNAAYLTDASDADLLAEKIMFLLENSREKKRLRQAGRERAELFTWEIQAEKLLILYKSLLS